MKKSITFLLQFESLDDQISPRKHVFSSLKKSRILALCLPIGFQRVAMRLILRWIEKDFSDGNQRLALARLESFVKTLNEEEGEFVRIYFSKARVQGCHLNLKSFKLPSKQRLFSWRERRTRKNCFECLDRCG